MESFDHLPFALPQPRKALFDLPAELRNNIYELVLTTAQRAPWELWQPNLTLTCRQMRREALPLFYSLLTFDLSPHFSSSHRAECGNVERWLKAIGDDKVKHFRHLRFHASLAPPGAANHRYLDLFLDLTEDGGAICRHGPPWCHSRHLYHANSVLAAWVKFIAKSANGAAWNVARILRVLDAFCRVRIGTQGRYERFELQRGWEDESWWGE